MSDSDVIEQWHAVPGFPHMEVTACGKVRSLTRRVPHSKGGTRLVRGRVRKQPLNKDGYLQVKHADCGVQKTVLVHRLIAMTFCPGYKPELQVNHLNGVKTDNRASNLEWVTLQQNIQHSVDNGLRARGERSGNAKLTEQDVIIIRELHSKKRRERDYRVTANRYGVHVETIRSIVRRKHWVHVPENTSAIPHR